MYEVNVLTGERRLLKRDPVLGGYDPDDYVTERLWATARDGTQDPGVAGLQERLPEERQGRAAAVRLRQLWLVAPTRGSRSYNVSLLDRGMVYAIAHIRGGQEMGRAWYDDGKLLNKKNTFTDFIDVTRFLVKEGYAAKDRVAALRRQRRRPADGRDRQHGARRITA